MRARRPERRCRGRGARSCAEALPPSPRGSGGASAARGARLAPPAAAEEAAESGGRPAGGGPQSRAGGRRSRSGRPPAPAPPLPARSGRWEPGAAGRLVGSPGRLSHLERAARGLTEKLLCRRSAPGRRWSSGERSGDPPCAAGPARSDATAAEGPSLSGAPSSGAARGLAGGCPSPPARGGASLPGDGAPRGLRALSPAAGTEGAARRPPEG